MTILPKILNLKNDGNILKVFSTPVAIAKCEKLQHLPCTLILCCNSTCEKSEIDASVFLSSYLKLIIGASKVLSINSTNNSINIIIKCRRAKSQGSTMSTNSNSLQAGSDS